MLGGPKEAPSRRIEVDSIYTSGDHLKGGGLLGGVSTLQETGLTGPISIYKLVQYFTLLHRVQVDSTGLQVNFWTPGGLHLNHS